MASVATLTEKLNVAIANQERGLNEMTRIRELLAAQREGGATPEEIEALEVQAEALVTSSQQLSDGLAGTT